MGLENEVYLFRLPSRYQEGQISVSMVRRRNDRCNKSRKGVKRAAEQYGVSLTTLCGRVTPGTKPDPKPYLTQEEEKELSSFPKSCAEVGYGKTRMDVMHIVQRVATDQRLLKGNKLSSGWWRRFLEWQPYLSLCRGDSTAHVRMDAVSEDTLKRYFSLFNDVMRVCPPF